MNRPTAHPLSPQAPLVPPASHLVAAGYGSPLLKQALVDSLIKFDPRQQVRNPVMFVVWLGALVTAALTVSPTLFGPSHASHLYNGVVTAILVITVWFANFAEALAEGRGKAKAASLRHTSTELHARRIVADGREETVSASALNKGDLVRVERDELIPMDGEVIDGIAYVDESVITGESAPVIKEAGSDVASSVTGGTKVISDSLLIRVTASPGDSFLDRMIRLVESAQRQKTPNEIALTVLLSVLTLIFVIVAAAMAPVASYLKAQINVADLVALIVALIPTTIGALLSAIGIAGIDRTMRFNMLATSGKAVEAAGDVHTLILDKTGTITVGNRMATALLPVAGCSAARLTQAAYLASLFDNTPEGRSTATYALNEGARPVVGQDKAVGTEFSAETRMSGSDLPDGRVIRKGAVDSVSRYVTEHYSRPVPPDLTALTEQVARQGATPLAVAENGDILGVIMLSDVLKTGIRDRMEQLRTMGIRTVMVTGDNPVTATVIAAEAGLDEVVAEARPEEKLTLIRREQAQGRLVAMTGDGTNDAPALAQADVGLAMYTGTMPAKEAANLIDLDSDPTKLLDLVAIGKQMLITRGALTTFSIANDVAKYFAILPALFITALPGLNALNVMGLATPQSAILSALIFNALIIPLLIPLALRGVRFQPKSAEVMFYRNLMLYGVGGLIAPFIGIKLIDLGLALVM
ncbi:potassium-transporting ATPase subunit KdpB [Crenobacter sp. SG2303]|uniref:Potassium-transporting ATPase ATP-binding subunit n=1 Tax=Crenobacter oryzisoli TaxID=3056844 RepID=A0ABT7XND6_9NEIS|nr:potassium-transporting ATPase subunit KdpB [Crenobacter sp. SG2303]MDN0075307.1 potassium-transporting ATPase subunit KdpB [Crenobacter sp. SG2303]